MATKAKNTKKDMSAANKARRENALVRRYLKMRLELKPRRGHRKSAEAAQHRLVKCQEKLTTATDPIEKLLLWSRIDQLEHSIIEIESSDRRRKEFLDLQEEFKKVIVPVSRRLGITFNAWVQVGVPPTVLKKGGLHPPKH